MSIQKFQAEFSFICRDSVFIYNICDVLSYLELWDMDFFESGTVIACWAKANNLSIYSAPRESFSYDAAIAKCISEKTDGVIVEDLS